VIANWTFEVNTPADASNTATGPSVTADIGAGAATGVHASAGTDWTTPTGNGSANSLSANEWQIGDYFQFQVNLTGFQDVTLAWDQTRSATGATTFDLQYSTDGSSFTTFSDNYTVLENLAGNGGTWNATTQIANYALSADLSSIAALDNDASVFFRLTAQVAGTATGGTGRVDNFVVNAVAQEVIPEPATLAIVGVLGGGLLMRRRTRSA
jgi:hypothetical protein